MRHPVLAIGAVGEDVSRLAALLGALAGTHNVAVSHEGSAVLSEQMMDAVESVRADLGVEELQFDGFLGRVVGPNAWRALEEAAAAALGFEIPAQQVQAPAGAEPVAEPVAEPTQGADASVPAAAVSSAEAPAEDVVPPSGEPPQAETSPQADVAAAGRFAASRTGNGTQ